MSVNVRSEDSADGLVNTLSSQSNAYSQLVTLARRQQSAICAKDTAALLQTIEGQQRLLVELSRLDENRVTFATGTAAAFGIADEPSLRSLIASAGPGLGSRLRRLREEILAYVADLARLNHQNSLLITSSMELTSATLNYMARGAENHTTYSPRGYRGSLAGAVSSVVVDRPA
jgi:flagellar biosynthesis/type III secretory pathway chaperone